MRTDKDGAAWSLRVHPWPVHPWLLPAALLLLVACARPEVRHGPDQQHVTRAELEALRARAGQIDGLKARLDALEARLKGLDRRVALGEQRVGLRPVETDRLTVAGPELEPIRPGDALLVRGFREPAKKRNLSRALKGYDGYVMVFWATWCVPCTSDEELALLAELQPQLARRNVALVSVAVDDLAKVQVHPKARRWIYPLWYAKDAHLAWLPQAFIQRVGVGLPIFLVVSRDGRVRYYRNKKLDAETVRDIVTVASN